MIQTNALGLLYLKDFKPKELEYLCKRPELEEVAKALEIRNRSSMKKSDLATAISEKLKGID